jgi:hypothetical protein
MSDDDRNDAAANALAWLRSRIEPTDYVAPAERAQTEAAIACIEAQQREIERLLPVSAFCEAFTTWFRAIEAGCQRAGREGRLGHGSDYVDMLFRIETDIHKSNLLWRLLYARQPLRTRMCPVHKGRWSGIDPCEHGCDSTGWIPDDWTMDTGATSAEGAERGGGT